MACVPCLPCLKKAISMVCRNIQARYYPHPSEFRGYHRFSAVLAVTGPVLLAKAMNGVHTPGDHDVGGHKVHLLKFDGAVKDAAGHVLISANGGDFRSPNRYHKLFHARKIYATTR